MNACTQLDLFTHHPSPEEMKPPVVALTPSAPTSPHAIAFLESQAAYYLLMIQRFMDGRKCSKGVRFYEMERLAAMRQAALKSISSFKAETRD